MQIRFLGTGAADWNGLDAKKGYRRFTSTLLDDELLLDVTETVLDQIPASAAIRDVFFTHSHRDHFQIHALQALAPCRVYAHKSWAHDIQGEGLTIVALEEGIPVQAGDFTVMPMPSNHSTERPEEVTLHFLIEKAGCRVFYATDGAWLRNEEKHMLDGKVLNAAIFDATIGDLVEGDFRIFEHNSVEMVRLMVKSMQKTGILGPNAPVFLTHLARTLHPNQKALEESLEKPLEACYDGRTVQI